MPADAARGRIFTKLGREIAVAAKGNPNPDTNSKLADAIAKAKANNMPNDNIKRTIEKARDPMPLTLRLPPLQTQCGGFGKTHSVLWREFIVIPEKIAAAIHICGITPRVFNGNYTNCK